MLIELEHQPAVAAALTDAQADVLFAAGLRRAELFLKSHAFSVGRIQAQVQHQAADSRLIEPAVGSGNAEISAAMSKFLKLTCVLTAGRELNVLLGGKGKRRGVARQSAGGKRKQRGTKHGGGNTGFTALHGYRSLLV